MNKLFSKIKVAAAFSAMTLVALASCVNEEYDLAKGIDMDVQILQNAALPIGNVAPISIKNILGDTDSTASVITEDEYGNMKLSFFQDVMTHTFTMPDVALDGDGGLMAQSADVKFNINANLTDVPGKELADLLISQYNTDVIYYTEEGVTYNPENSLVFKQINVDLDKELPEQVLSVRSIDMDASLNFIFTVSDGAIMHLDEGFIIEFPHYMVLDPVDKTVDFEVVDGYKVVFGQDTGISYESPLILSFNFTKLQNIESFVNERTDEAGVTARYLTNKDNIDVTGRLYLKASDYGDEHIPDLPQMKMDVQLTDLSMSSAELIIDMDIAIEDRNVEIGELPELFNAEGTVVDLYNPILRFKLDNDSPLDMNLNAEITAISDSRTTDIHVGDNCKNGNRETESIIIPGETEVEYYLSRLGKHDTTFGKDIEIEEIAEIISDIPDQITIHDIQVESQRKYINIAPNQEYNVNMEYEFFSPMSFGKDVRIAFERDIDLGLEGGSIGIDSLVLSMNMVNTIPLNFNIQGVALSSDGKVIKDAAVSLDFNLLAGTVDNPSTSPIEIVITSGNKEINLAKLRLQFEATSSTEMQGEVLNTAQGLAINGIHVRLPQGVKLDLTKN